MAMSEGDTPVRIVKKKQRGHGGHHGGAWKVAYADFVTAMMSLFIVLWIVGQSKQVKQYVAYYFKDPGAFSETTKGKGLLEGGGHDIMKDESMGDLVRAKQEERLKSMADSIMGDLSRKEDVKLLLNQVKMELVKEGLRIEMVETNESYFFDVGTASLKKEARAVLATIGNQVGKLPNHVIIEGHTDSRQYSNDLGYTNFELSADRANSARRVLITSGLRRNQVDEVRGYADSRLKLPDAPLDASNRRISVTIKFEGQ